MVSHLAAGILGGLLAGGGLLFAGDKLGIAGPDQSETQKSELRLASIEDQIKKLNTRTSAEPAVPASVSKSIEDVAALREELNRLAETQTAVQAETKTLREQAEKVSTDQAAVTNTARRLQSMENRLKAIGEAAKDKGGNNVAQLAKLNAQLATVENAIDQKITALRQSLDKRLASETEAMSTRLSDGIKTLPELQNLQAGSERFGVELETTRAGLDEIKTAVTSLQGDVAKAREETSSSISEALKPLADKVETIAGSVASLEQRGAAQEQKAKAVVLALELNNLKKAMARGEPFAEELAAVKKTAGGDIDLSSLEAVADGSVPSRKALTERFDKVADQMIAATLPKADEGNFLDRIVSNAKSIVRVRKTGMVEGDSVEAIAARMEVAITNGKFTKAIEEAKALPDDARKVAGDYLKQLQARMDVEQAMSRLEQSIRATATPS